MPSLAFVRVSVLAFALGGCATIPTQYTPQSFLSLSGSSAQVGQFTYLPEIEGRVKPNQIQNTAIGQILIGEDVASYVRRATGSELRNAGVDLGNTRSNIITGEVVEFKADDLGFSVTWSFTVTYEIRRPQGGEARFRKTYSSTTRESGKFQQPSDYTAMMNILIVDAIEQFMRDIKTSRLLQ